MRLFVALDLPDEVREQLETLCAGVPQMRWVPPENLHITLRFVGSVDNAAARDLDDALAAITFPSFELSLAGVGAFDEGRVVNTLWVGVPQNEALTRLQGKVEQAVSRAGLNSGRQRKFKPHVSLARGRAAFEPKLQGWLTRHALFRTPPFEVDSFALFSSILNPTGAQYTKEVDYPLERAYAG